MSDASGVAKLVPLEVPGPSGPLEALLQERDEGEHGWIAVMCHPHPLYGGTLHNKVVHRAAATLFALGCAVLRFNFRGTGRSAGTHDRGVGEVEDARAALGFLSARHPEARRILGGFSFGAAMAAKLAVTEPRLERLVLIAPPVTSHDFSGLESAAVPKLVIQGTADVTCPPVHLKEQYPAWAEPKRLIEIAGATHFFDRQLAEVARALDEDLAPLVRGGA